MELFSIKIRCTFQLVSTTKYKPIERDVFVMTFRACKRYMITGMTKESEDTLIERLISISNLMR